MTYSTCPRAVGKRSGCVPWEGGVCPICGGTGLVEDAPDPAVVAEEVKRPERPAGFFEF